MEPTTVTLTKERAIVEFPNGRQLEASIDFFEFVGTELAKSQWTFADLVKDDGQHRIACLSTNASPDGKESIWFANKYLEGCGITTIYEWYLNREKIGQKTPGKKLPNGQKVSDRKISLP